MVQKADSGKNEKPKAKSSFILMMVLVVVIFVLIGYFLVWPKYVNLADANNELKERGQFLESQTAMLGDIKELVRNHESISSAEKTRLDSFLPSEIDEPGLFTLFEFLSAKNNIELLAIDISEKEPAAELKNFGIKEINISANFTGGSYDDAKNLFADLETNLRVMDIVSVNYNPDPLSMALNVRTYRLESSPSAVK